MFAQDIRLNEFNRDYLENLLKSLPSDSLDQVAFDGAHSVRWILAHLAIAADYGILQFGEPMQMPSEWHHAYGPGSQPTSHTTILPSQEELVSAIERGYERLTTLAKNQATEALNAPHTVQLLSKTPLKSKADIVSHILATHFATHVGQLSVLRRMAGKKPLF